MYPCKANFPQTMAIANTPGSSHDGDEEENPSQHHELGGKSR